MLRVDPGERMTAEDILYNGFIRGFITQDVLDAVDAELEQYEEDEDTEATLEVDIQSIASL